MDTSWWRWGSSRAVAKVTVLRYSMIPIQYLMYVKKCHTPPTKRANWFLSSYEPSRWVGEAWWWNAMPFFSYFVASETHPSPEISHFFTKPTWTTGCFYLVCWSLQVSDVNKGIDSFHGSTNPCHDLKRHNLRNSCVGNDIRTVCADTDMSMFGCTCTCWYRSEGPSITQALRA